MSAGEQRARSMRSLRAFFSEGGAMAMFWFALVFIAIAWTWGMDPLAFPSPDEAVNRLAASLIHEHGRPVLHLAFNDEEDLAHPRFWVRLGDRAVPAYAPVMFYLYAAIVSIPVIGMWLVPALPASGAAAFTLGTARLLPRGRRWLAMLSPVIGFPALYWLMRPWVNISLLLVCLCWAVFCWASWRSSEEPRRRRRWLLAAMGFVGAAVAVRPDYAAYLTLAALLFSLAESRGEWKLIFVAVFGAGAAAVAANLILNLVITGHFKAAYQIYMDRQSDAGEPTFLPGILNSLLTPMGVHTPAEIWGFFAKYWLNMRPVGLLVIGQLALVPLLYAAPRRKRLFYLAAILVIMCLAVTRLSDEVYGSRGKIGYVHHSVPRYLSPVYLLAALPPILLLGRRRVGVTMGFGTALALVLAWRSTYEIALHQPDSLKYVRRLLAADERTVRIISGRVPKRAMIYTVTEDKVFCQRFRVGIAAGPRETAASMHRAARAGIPVFFVQPRFPSRKLRALERALGRYHHRLRLVEKKRGAYRLE